MNTYAWTISSLDRYTSYEELTDVVTVIHWRLRGENPDGVTGEVYGAQAIPTPSADDFVSFENLTQEIVEGWLLDSLGEEKVQQFKSSVDTLITEKITPSRIRSSPPWN